MGDHNKKKTLQANPRLELEELYQGIPDESVNLTFQDLANLNSSPPPQHKKNTTTMSTINDPISDSSMVSSNPTKVPSSPSLSPLSLTPSHDFRKGLHPYSNHSHHHHDINNHHHHHHHRRGGAQSPQSRASEYSMGYDHAMSGESLASGKGGGAGRRRRPGIPHSKICTICNNYVYFFRTRCLVCGRVYCRQCVELGMGDMTEGRKCIECLGLRFSQRYIERAGMVGCCSWRYPSTLKQVELKWAEKGPRRSGDRGYGHQGMASSRPRTPVTPRSPLSIASNEASFVMSATYSPFSPHHHHLPL